MCGIFAAFSRNDKARCIADLKSAGAVVGHRGPDETYEYCSNSFAAVNKRLAVTGRRFSLAELLHGSALAYNGEIYNWKNDATLDIHPRNDTEYLLAKLLAEVDGDVATSIRALEGQFAFVFYNGRKVVAARDRLGIKPLYFGKDRAGNLLFSSEIKQLENYDLEFWRLVGPGQYLVATADDLVIENYAQPPLNDVAHRSVSVNVSTLAKRFKNAVSSRYPQESSVGVLLSGGVDSTLVALEAARYARERGLDPPVAFCACVPGSEERIYAEDVANALGMRIVTKVVELPELLRDLESIIRQVETYDLASINMGVIQWFAAKMAKAEGIRVLLSGTVADEVFAGYVQWKSLSRLQLATATEFYLRNMHSFDLQVTDRVTMAHGIEARLPFGDSRVVEYAMKIPLDQRLNRRGRVCTEKWILRMVGHRLVDKYVEGMAANSWSCSERLLRSVWRPKYAQDIGVRDMMASYVTHFRRNLRMNAGDWPIKGFHLPTVNFYFSVFASLFPEMARRRFDYSRKVFDVGIGRL